MDVHQRISGVFMALLGGLGLLWVLLGMLMSLGMMDRLFWAPPGLTVGLGMLLVAALGLAYCLWCLAAVVGGVSAFQGDARARRLLVPVAVLALVGFPLGTAAGVYTLWAWWRPAPAPR